MIEGKTRAQADPNRWTVGWLALSALLPPARKAYGWVAVGETLVHIDPYARAGAYDWQRDYEPVGRIDTSIRLYHIP